MTAHCPHFTPRYAVALRTANSNLATPEQRQAARDEMEDIRDQMLDGYVGGDARFLTDAELRDRNVDAYRPARLADLRTPKPSGFWIIDAFTALWVLGLAALLCAAAVGIVVALSNHIGERAAITAHQATLPEFREWDGEAR